MHILTYGSDTYISDTRYTAKYKENTDTWVLMIKSVQLKDSGVFECQLSSMPVTSYAVRLNVVDITVDIVGDEELYVQADSSIIITCVVTNLKHSDKNIVWKHNGHIIHPSSSLSIETVIDEVLTMTMTSYLSIHRIQTNYGGKYQCGPSGLKQAYIQLHVLNGDRTYELQPSHASCGISFKENYFKSFLVTFHTMMMIIISYCSRK